MPVNCTIRISRKSSRSLISDSLIAINTDSLHWFCRPFEDVMIMNQIVESLPDLLKATLFQNPVERAFKMRVAVLHIRRYRCHHFRELLSINPGETHTYHLGEGGSDLLITRPRLSTRETFEMAFTLRQFEHFFEHIGRADNSPERLVYLAKGLAELGDQVREVCLIYFHFALPELQAICYSQGNLAKERTRLHLTLTELEALLTQEKGALERFLRNLKRTTS